MSDKNRIPPFQIPRIAGHGRTGELGALLTKPLSPALIEEMGEGNAFPNGSGFDPAGDWVCSYRVWGNHAFSVFQNKDMGHITIARKGGGDNVAFEVRQVIVNQDGMFQRMEATFDCAKDELASVSKWTFSSVCYDAAQCPIPELDLNVTGQVDSGTVTMTVNGVQEKQPLPGPLVSQWLIPDLLQRNDSSLSGFHILEHGVKIKAGHSIEPTGTDNGLQKIAQRGHGILPWEYYRDADNRILYGFSCTVMMILDPDAPKKTDMLIEQLLQGVVHHEY